MVENIVREGSLVDYVTYLPAPVIINGWGEVAHGILRWYNRESASWVVSYCDLKRHQVGESTYVHSAAEAKELVRDLWQWDTPEDADAPWD